MDRITKALLQEYCKEHNLTRLTEDKQFEYFTTYLVMNRFQIDTVDPADIVVGDGGDTSLDAIGIVANGSLILETDQIEELAKQNNYLDVTFVFVQAERSTSFSSAKIGEIGFGVEEFFKEQPTLPRNAAIKETAEVMRAIYDKSGLFRRGNPSCRIFYATTGKWVEDQHLDARRKAVVSALGTLGLFGEIEFTPIGAEALQKLYRESQNSITREFAFAERTVVPEIGGVNEAYLGFLPAEDYLRLITDENGAIIKSIFYDNVRDFQDYNDVNTGIRSTISDASLRARFVLMNNGVTIIAKTLRTTGNRFTIEDYQIVNGCQTSHVLYDSRDKLDESVMVPIRLISTRDEEVIASIIKATNRQTQVKEEQLLALTEFQKSLEEYFKSFENGKKLYYERRSCQYNNATGIEKTRVISRQALIQAFTAMILEEPHRVTRSTAGVRESIGKAIFAKDHRYEPYYLAALALYRLEYLFRNQSLESYHKPARHHILLAFRLLANPEPPPNRANSHEMARYCEALMPFLWDAAEAERRFRQATAIVSELAGGNLDRDSIRTLTFTDKLKQRFRAKPKA
jgi:hypothetical protein